MRDSILRVAAAHRAKPEGERDIPNKTFALYAAEIQDILEKNNVEIFKSEIGTDFVPVKQKALKKTAADDETRHGKVAESLSDGYSCDGKVISAEKVAVYYYEKPCETETTMNTEETQNG
jgi:molecular chaperone GrpE (heat shock protein)